jgi:hypothetical protein
LLANTALVLAIGALGVFFRDSGGCSHFAMVPLAAQPAKKCALEAIGIESVDLGTPVLTRHRDACGMNDMRVDALGAEPAGEPKTVSAGLEGDRDAFDLVPCLLRFVAPSMQKLQ